MVQKVLLPGNRFEMKIYHTSGAKKQSSPIKRTGLPLPPRESPRVVAMKLKPTRCNRAGAGVIVKK